MDTDMNWSLKELYSSFECKELACDFEQLKKFIDRLQSFADNDLNSSETAVYKIEEFIKISQDIRNLASKLEAFSSLSISVNAKDENAKRLNEALEQIMTKTIQPEVKFQKWLLAIDNIDALIASSKLLKEHEFYLKELIEKAQYTLDENQETVISEMKLNGSVAWRKLHNYLNSTLLVDISMDGKDLKLPLTYVRNLAYDSCQSTRKTAYEAELKAYKKIEDSIAYCLNGIKGEVLTLSKLKGYSSPLDMTLKNSRMDKETLDSMLSAIKESLPAFRKYYRKKAELLGHKNGLPFYDIFAPVGSSDISYSFEDARDFVVSNLSIFSKEMGNFVDKAFEHNWIDAKPREGKRGGAFCHYIPSIKESRVLCTFTGSFKNVITLAHELGHAFHGSCLNNESNLNINYPMPLAETASIFSETIVKNAALKEAPEAAVLPILEGSLTGSGQTVVDIYSRFLFESRVFKLRKSGSLTAGELCDMMCKAQLDAYGDGLDPDYLHPYMWINKQHYYYPERNFYNFPYAFGLLFAKGLYAEYLKRGSSFIEDYKKLLSDTGKKNVTDITREIGIDVHSVDFWKSSLKIIEEEINKFIELA